MRQRQRGEIVKRRDKQLVLDRMNREIEQTTDPRRAQAISAQAEAMRHLAKKTKEGVDLINRAVQVKLRAQRRIGELILQMKANGMFGPGGDRRSASHDEKLKIRDLGIDHNEASRCQQIANIPEKIFDKSFQLANEMQIELSSASFLRMARKYCCKVGRRRPKPKPGRMRDKLSTTVLGISCPVEAVDYLHEVHNHLVTVDSILRPMCDGSQARLHDVERKHLHRLLSESSEILTQVIASITSYSPSRPNKCNAN